MIFCQGAIPSSTQFKHIHYAGHASVTNVYSYIIHILKQDIN